MSGFLRKAVFSLFLLLITALLLGSALWNNFPAGQSWGLFSAGMVVIALTVVYWFFERCRVSSREIAVIAVLATIAAVGRIPFAALPGIQPTTFTIIVSGFVFGPRAGFMVGSTAALVSNFFLGQGPWTPWQMFAWGLAGTSAGIIKVILPRIGRRGMTVFSFCWGYLFGWIMNLWFWTSFIHPMSWQSLVATYATSFWFDTLHAAGNGAFYLFFGDSLVKMLKRYRRRLTTSIIEKSC